MSVLLFKNNAVNSTLAGSITSASTTVTLTAGQGALFPSPGANQDFIGTFVDAATGKINEIVNCTSRSGDVLTIVRAQEGTAALNWNAGDFFSNFWTAGSAGAMLQQGQAQQQATNYAVDSGSADSLVITLSPAPTALSGLTGAPIRVLVAATSVTTSPAINVNGLGAITIVNKATAGTVGVPAGTLALGKIVELVYDGTFFQYNGPVEPATKAQIEAGTAGDMPITPAALLAAYPGAADAGTNGGHIYMPGGFLYQWGNYNAVGTSPITVNFPLTYSSAPRIVCTATQSSGVLPGTPAIITLSSILVSGFTAYDCLWNGSSFINNTGSSFHWHAIGPAAAA